MTFWLGIWIGASAIAGLWLGLTFLRPVWSIRRYRIALRTITELTSDLEYYEPGTSPFSAAVEIAKEALDDEEEQLEVKPKDRP